MQSTKSQILALLKRRGRCGVDELVAALGIAPMTARQHLATLERDELVSFNEERQRLGRPHHVFFLTEKGEASFPPDFDRLAAYLLRAVCELQSSEIAGLTAEEKTSLLFDKIADQFVDSYGLRLRGLALPDRVAAVASILQQEGGFAEWRQIGDGYEILDYNCLYRRLNAPAPGPCRWHERILSELLDRPVEVCFAAPPSAQLCRFVVHASGEPQGSQTPRVRDATKPASRAFGVERAAARPGAADTL